MEGSRRGVAWVATVLVGCALTVSASGCGSDESSALDPAAVQTADPEKAFAPLVELAADEPWRPMSTRWFVERSTFWFAEDDGCADRKIAVGHTLPEQQTPDIDWIYPKGLGGWSWPAYYRNPYDAKCKNDFDERFYADELTRPRDPGPRAAGLRPGEGFYLDLVDDARGGPARSVAAPTYFQRTEEGDGGVRLTYWMLFGMHGVAGEPDAHEGDWERIDVVLETEGDRYVPRAVQTDGYASETAWSAARKTDDTHPVVTSARSTHAMTAAKLGSRCAGCVGVSTWRALADVRKELWYGFGGAWGQVGATSATTGPLGPHGFFPTVADKAQADAGV